MEGNMICCCQRNRASFLVPFHATPPHITEEFCLSVVSKELVDGSKQEDQEKESIHHQNYELPLLPRKLLIPKGGGGNYDS